MTGQAEFDGEGGTESSNSFAPEESLLRTRLSGAHPVSKSGFTGTGQTQPNLAIGGLLPSELRSLTEPISGVAWQRSIPG